jgi:hypothetical protein
LLIAQFTAASGATVSNQLSKGENTMESQKFELLRKMEEKGVTLVEGAEKIGFDPSLLKLYFAPDAYPVPQRIIDKLTEAISN